MFLLIETPLELEAWTKENTLSDLAVTKPTWFTIFSYWLEQGIQYPENGLLWKENFELAKDQGDFPAGIYKTIAQAKEGKGITIDFEKLLGNSMLNGLKVWKL